MASIFRPRLLDGKTASSQTAAVIFRKNSIRASRSDFLKPIFVMMSAEEGGASNRISGRNTMPMSALLRERT
jgi:hypothetical protein